MLTTNWPSASHSKVTRAHRPKRRKRPPSKAVKAQRREALDKSQIPNRGAYAVKVFAWAGHEGALDEMDAVKRYAPTVPPVTEMPVRPTVTHPECIEPTSRAAIAGAHTILKLRDPSPVPYLWRGLPTHKF